MKLLACAALLFLAAPARAQLDETQLFEASRRPKKPKDEPPQAVARAIEMAFSSGTWTTLQISTAGPVVELSRLVAQGYYKRELITLVVVAARAKKPFQELVAKRRKGETLEDISLGCGLDYDKVYEAALAVEEIVDKQYLPRFPQRPPRRPREEPY